MPRVNLTGSSAVVTGGASGIGEASARQLAEAGCKSILEVNDHRSCDANAIMFDSFIESTEALTGDGIVGSTMIPSGSDFATQFRNALQRFAQAISIASHATLVPDQEA